MSKATNYSDGYTQAPLTKEWVENFYNLVTADLWTTVVVDTGSTVTRRIGGGVDLTTDGTDDDEVSISSTAFILPGTTNTPASGQLVSKVIPLSLGDGTATTHSWISGFGSSFAADILGATTTHAIPAAGYYLALCQIKAETRPRLVCISNGTATVNQILDFVPVVNQAFSYRITFNKPIAATVTATVDIDPAGGQNFLPVRAYGASPIHPAFYETPNIYGCFPAAGLKVGTYAKNGGTNTSGRTFAVEYFAWSVNRSA